MINLDLAVLAMPLKHEQAARDSFIVP